MDHSSERPLRGTAPINQCIMNGNYEFYFYDSVPANPECIQYKSQPFQRNSNRVVPPMYINFAPIIDNAGPDNSRHHVVAEFYLSLSDVQRICNRKRVPGKNQVVTQLRVRIGEKLPAMNELSEELPQPLLMWINCIQIFPKDFKSPLNVNASDYLYLHTVSVNRVRMLWPQCRRPYYMVVNLVAIISVEELVQDIKMDDDRYFFALDTKNGIVGKFW